MSSELMSFQTQTSKLMGDAAPVCQEEKLTQQLETGSNLAWMAYREKLPQLIPPLDGCVEAVLPDLEKLTELLEKHEVRLQRFEKLKAGHWAYADVANWISFCLSIGRFVGPTLEAHDFGDKDLEFSLHRLLDHLRVMLLLRNDLKKNGLLHGLFNAMSAVVRVPGPYQLCFFFADHVRFGDCKGDMSDYRIPWRIIKKQSRI